MRHLWSLALLCLFLLHPRAFAATDFAVAAYAIPTDAVKVEGSGGMRRGEKYYNYFPVGAAITSKNRIATEMYYKGVLIQRKLFKNELKYGIQRQWYTNGQLKSEEPYNLDVMDGTFRHWNQKGQLVGEYEMNHGTGTRRIYDDDGVLMREEPFVNNRNDGMLMAVSEIMHIRSLVPYKNGQTINQAFDFYPDDTLDGVTFLLWTDYPNPMAGFSVDFNQQGNIKSKNWILNYDVVTEEEYAKAAAQDKTLPPYYADAQRYKEFVTPEIKAILLKYRTMPRVKIPLEFDALGNPVLAPAPPIAKTP